MATFFFPGTWDTLTAEELANSRARLSGFIEAVPEEDKIVREILQDLFYQRRTGKRSYKQLEVVQKALLPLQDSILALVKLIATLAVDKGKPEAQAVLANLRKTDESLRDRLFILQVWRKYDRETADRLARTKAGEFLDPDLAKVLEVRQKRLDREKREKEKEKEKFGRAKFWRNGPANGQDWQVPHSSGYSSPTGLESHGGRYGGDGQGGDGPAKGTKRPSEQNRCHTCGGTDHFFKQCENGSDGSE